MESKIVVDMHLLKINRDLCKSYDTVYKFLLIYINNLKSDIMKKTLGINRNKLQIFQGAKLSTMKRKNRFKSISKE